jgi:hypothetical protein
LARRESLIADTGLSHLLRIPSLTHLNLRGSLITDTGLNLLCDLPLTECRLGSCQRITCGGFDRWRSLVVLDLTNCSKITDQGLLTLVHLPLEQIVLRGCVSITETGLDNLPHIFFDRFLIEGCNFTDTWLAARSRRHETELGI